MGGAKLEILTFDYWPNYRYPLQYNISEFMILLNNVTYFRASFFCHSQKICTENILEWSCLKERMTLKCTHMLVSLSSLLLQKIINPQHLNFRFFNTSRILSLLEKNSTTIFFLKGKHFFLKILEYLLMFKNKKVHGFIVKLLYTINDFDQQTL